MAIQMKKALILDDYIIIAGTITMFCSPQLKVTNKILCRIAGQILDNAECTGYNSYGHKCIISS